jgi:hypothetical protein
MLRDGGASENNSPNSRNSLSPSSVSASDDASTTGIWFLQRSPMAEEESLGSVVHKGNNPSTRPPVFWLCWKKMKIQAVVRARNGVETTVWDE